MTSKGIVIVRDGRLVSERYFNGDSVNTLHDIRSGTKSLTSLLIGIALQKGLIHSIDDSIAPYLPGLPKDGREKITTKDLLTMRSGLDAYDDDTSSPGNENTLDASSDWIRTVYAAPMKLTPGDLFRTRCMAQERHTRTRFSDPIRRAILGTAMA